MESANRKCFIAAPETVPGRRTRGTEVRQLPVFLRCFRIALERKQCARKHEPRLLMIRLQTQDCPERLDSFESIAELQARGAKEEPCRPQLGIQFYGRFQLRNRFALISGHVKRHAEIQEQAWIVWEGMVQFAIERNGFGELALRHEFLGALGFSGQILGLSQAAGWFRKQGYAEKEWPCGFHPCSHDGKSSSFIRIRGLERL